MFTVPTVEETQLAACPIQQKYKKTTDAAEEFKEAFSAWTKTISFGAEPACNLYQFQIGFMFATILKIESDTLYFGVLCQASKLIQNVQPNSISFTKFSLDEFETNMPYEIAYEVKIMTIEGELQ